MSLRERIFSLETEYGAQFYADDKMPVPPNPERCVRVLVRVISDAHSAAAGDYLVNGSKFHYDVGHPEWSLPECRSAREAASYDKAADLLLREAVPEVLDRLKAERYEGHFLLFKNNVDSAGHTFGCHENYMMQRDTTLLGGTPFKRYMVRCLVPFLVTRQLMCGAGSLKFTERGSPVFSLSQRAEFTSAVASVETMHNRAIVNLGRENEPWSPKGYRRLHLILGDSNMSGWATWMKLGTTGLLLRMIEDLYPNEVPLLADPVQALRDISRDPSCTKTVPLRDGSRVRALDIQRYYYETACDYVERFGFSDEEDEILEAWEQALNDLEEDPARLSDRADWAIKRMLMAANLEKLGGSWEAWDADPESISSLKAVDLRFHDLSSQGYYARLYADDTLVSADEIECAQKEPPPYTRANIRGRAIAGARLNGSSASAENWSNLEVDGSMLYLRDPLQFAHRKVQETYKEADLNVALQHADAEVRVRAAGYLGWNRTERALRTLAAVSEGDTDERVRCAAVRAIGGMEMDSTFPVLIECLKSREAHIRWAAEETLLQSSSPPSSQNMEEPNEGPDDDETLVNIIR